MRVVTFMLARQNLSNCNCLVGVVAKNDGLYTVSTHLRTCLQQLSRCHSYTHQLAKTCGYGDLRRICMLAICLRPHPYMYCVL